MNYLGLFVLVLAALIFAATCFCAIGWFVLTIKELVDKFMERYLPRFYYYDYDEEI